MIYKRTAEEGSKDGIGDRQCQLCPDLTSRRIGKCLKNLLEKTSCARGAQKNAGPGD